MTWLFVDPVCPKPYCATSLDNGGIGGTEASVIRIAEALAFEEPVDVMQHCRTDTNNSNRARYVPFDWSKVREPISCMVVLRCPDTALAMRQKYKSGPIYLWCHDLANKRLGTLLPALHKARVKIIAVSHFHRHNILEASRTFCPGEDIPQIEVIYPPIEDSLAPDATPVNPNKLIFFSSPHKGLKNTLDVFNSLKSFNPKLELYIANPGYLDWSPDATPGVHILGAIPRAEALQHVREAFCVFYLNHVFPETYGLVFAESNAVGTPVLTHPLGAAREVLDNPQQFVDTKDRKLVIDHFLNWQQPGNRPIVEGQTKFKLSSVLTKWRKLD